MPLGAYGVTHRAVESGAVFWVRITNPFCDLEPMGGDTTIWHGEPLCSSGDCQQPHRVSQY